MPTVEQSKGYMIERIRYIRSNDCPICFYPMDFQNDGEYGRRLHCGGFPQLLPHQQQR